MHEFYELSTAFHVLERRIFSRSINVALPEKYAAEFKQDATACQNQVMWACLRMYNMQEILNFLEAVQVSHVMNKELNFFKPLDMAKHH